ncbi:MAG: hypothetical protein BGO51_22640 [Rhodospirillales bacterium 69-11]|nr:DMT family transporter [Rhodospirillales bacterium]OJW31319.1 MAG: hypothetical protein BGO51_22640 [Rhodospirillales bacterium 69-11]
MPPREDPIRGIVLAVGATMQFAIADTTAKFLSTSLPIVELAWIRYVIFVVVGLALVRPGSPAALRTRDPGWQILRGFCVVGSSVLFVYGIRSMTMAQATTISFLSPLIVTVLSIPLLGEVVGLRRWAAVAAGMAGMLIVVRPGAGSFDPAALFGVASSCCWAFALIITRKIAGRDPPGITVVWSASVGTLVLTCLLPFEAIWPAWWQLGLAALLGVLSAGGQFMVVLAHQHAPASMLAPFFYVQLLWVIVSGYVVFGNLPDRWTLVGAAVIVSSGLYTAHRERIRRRTAARAQA